MLQLTVSWRSSLLFVSIALALESQGCYIVDAFQSDMDSTVLCNIIQN